MRFNTSFDLFATGPIQLLSDGGPSMSCLRLKVVSHSMSALPSLTSTKVATTLFIFLNFVLPRGKFQTRVANVRFLYSEATSNVSGRSFPTNKKVMSALPSLTSTKSSRDIV